MDLAEDLHVKDLSFDEAEEEQKETLKKFEDFKKRVYPPTGPKPIKTSKDKMDNVIENAEGIDNFRNKIINEIKKA